MKTSLLTLAVISTAVVNFSFVTHASADEAQKAAIVPSTLSPSNNTLTPFELVFGAYQGHFQTQGIPEGTTLVFAYQMGRLSAQEVVEQAIKTNLISSQLNTTGYVNAVDSLLRGLNGR
ncbi:hypothetical protein ACKFKG_20790 [Phormidesmis sp. 146-35]